MADIEDYKKRLDEQTEDYYKMARDQEYSALLNKEVALENAKANAMKYTNNAINARGFGGTGYGSSLYSGMYNNYLNRANEAQATYNQNVNQFNLDEKQAYINNAERAEEKDNNRFANVTSAIQAEGLAQADIDQYLADSGYGTISSDGTFTFNAEKPEGIDDLNWNQLKLYYKARSNELAEESGTEADIKDIAKVTGNSNPRGYDINTLGQLTAGAYDDKPLSSEFQYEYNKLIVAQQKNELDENGTAIVLQRGNDKGESPRYLFYKNGIFYPMPKSNYEQFKGKRIRFNNRTMTEE